MSISELIIKITIAVLICILILVILRIATWILKDLAQLKEIKNKELENDKLRLYSTLDPKAIREELNDLIRQYVARYMTKDILANQVAYIKNDQADSMVKEITKEVILDMSDLYLTYCKLLYNINSQDDLTKVIYFLTIDIVLNTVTNFNGNNQE